MSNNALHTFEGVKLNLSYKNVMLYSYFLSNKDAARALLSINCKVYPDNDYISRLNKYLMDSRFTNHKKSDVELMYEDGEITLDELNQYYKDNRKFCHRGDFDLIYALFMERYNIDLINDYNLSWFEYKMLLENLFEEKTNSLRERINHRNFKPSKGKGNEKMNEQGKKLKEIYSL